METSSASTVHRHETAIPFLRKKKFDGRKVGGSKDTTNRREVRMRSLSSPFQKKLAKHRRLFFQYGKGKKEGHSRESKRETGSGKPN